MFTIRELRANPHFAPSFARVHALCWPILWWQLNRLCLLFQRLGVGNILYSVNSWGMVAVHYIGDKIGPAAYKRPERTFRPLTDASWGSDVPAIASDAPGRALCNALILPCKAGEVAPKGSEGALPSPPNTS